MGNRGESDSAFRVEITPLLDPCRQSPHEIRHFTSPVSSLSRVRFNIKKQTGGFAGGSGHNLNQLPLPVDHRQIHLLRALDGKKEIFSVYDLAAQHVAPHAFSVQRLGGFDFHASGGRQSRKQVLDGEDLR